MIDNDTHKNEFASVSSKRIFKSLYEYVETFCYALVLMMLLTLFVFRPVSVIGDSMNYTLASDDKLIISNLAYTPKTGDIVVLKFSPLPLIKRVIATEGQTVKIDYASWAVYVDGVQLEESYINRESCTMNISTTRKSVDEFVVGDGMIYVMGDNRNHSSDSRDFGPFKETDILGRVICRVFPLSDFGDVDA